jgi:formylglycine-generating enzyme
MFVPKPILRAALAALCCWPMAAARSWAAGDTLHIDLGAGAALELVEIAPGEFTQGSKESEPGHQADEAQREVRLTKKFYLGKYPVTYSQFERFVKESGYKTEAEKGSSGGYGWTPNGLVQRKGFTWRDPGFAQTALHPATLVTFGDAKAFLSWLSRKSGREFQLPSEAQWEYACRAGTKTAWPNGDDPAAADALSWNKTTASAGTMPVGQKPLNAWGLGDMLGDVWEWCEDWYGPYEPGPVTDPVQTNPRLSDKPRRVLRGGSFMRERTDCRSAARYRNDPASRNPDNGFRVMTFLGEATAATPAAAPAPAKQPAAGPPPTDVELPDRAKGAGPVGEAAPRVAQGMLFLPSIGFAVIFAVFIGVLALLGRLLRRGGGFPPVGGGGPIFGGGGGRVITRIGNDGFWITGENIPVGTSMVCRYEADGAEQEVQVPYEPGPEGQFVYTGQRPSNVTVVIAGQSSLFQGPVVRNIVSPPYGSSGTVTPMTSSDDSTPSPPTNPPAY